MPLQHFDLVSVRILNEEEPRQQGSIPLEFDNFSWRKSGSFEPGVLSIQVVDTKRDVPIAVAKIVRLRTILVYGQLHLEVSRGISEINQSKTIEIKSIRDIQTKCCLVEGDRACFIEHAKHRVYCFSQLSLPNDRLRDRGERMPAI